MRRLRLAREETVTREGAAADTSDVRALVVVCLALVACEGRLISPEDGAGGGAGPTTSADASVSGSDGGVDAGLGGGGLGGGTGGGGGGGGGGAAGGGAGDAGAATVDAGLGGPCGTLASRVTVAQVSVAPASVDVGSSYGWSNNRPVHLAPLANGGARVAWSSSGTVHVTPLDAALARSGPDVTLAGESVRGFVAHDDGAAALLVVRGTGMWLVRLAPSGVPAYEVPIVNDPPSDTEGARWVDNWGHEGRLLFTGTHYVAYFGHTKHWGAMGKHQGDLLASFDAATGAPGGPASWAWGCSHSLDVRLAWDGTQVAPVCLSDCYRVKGVLLDDSTLLVDEPSGNCAGSSDGELGGLAPLPGGGFALTFSSREGRPTRNVGFLTITPSRQKGAVVWLTTAEASRPNLARYGDRLLAAWQEGGAQQLAVLSPAGAVLEGPVPAGGGWAARDDFASWPAGHVGWAAGSGSTLTVTRVRQCVP